MDLRNRFAFRLQTVAACVVLCALATGCGGGSRAVPPPSRTQTAVGDPPAAIQAQVPARPSFIDTVPPPPPAAGAATRAPSAAAAHPAFFNGETPVGNGVYYLVLPNSNLFGYYSYLSDPRYIYHFDLGYEFLIDANDGKGGIYMYDFASKHWWFTGAQYSFPYIWDFGLKSGLYYYPDAKRPDHYTTNPRYFYDFKARAVTTLDPTVVWQVGGGTLGQYSTPYPTDGQCSGVGPKITGHNATFDMIRNTNSTYNYNGTVYPRASTCWRNQMNPIDPKTGEIYLLQFGQTYVWTFTTVVNLNGNFTYQGASDGGLAGDIPMNVLRILPVTTATAARAPKKHPDHLPRSPTTGSRSTATRHKAPHPSEHPVSYTEDQFRPVAHDSPGLPLTTAKSTTGRSMPSRCRMEAAADHGP